MKNPKSNVDMVMQDGDKMIVELHSDIVEILGEVTASNTSFAQQFLQKPSASCQFVIGSKPTIDMNGGDLCFSTSFLEKPLNFLYLTKRQG